jgi:hypothetical protein
VSNDHGPAKSSDCSEKPTCHLLDQEHEQQVLEKPAHRYHIISSYRVLIPKMEEKRKEKKRTGKPGTSSMSSLLSSLWTTSY